MVAKATVSEREEMAGSDWRKPTARPMTVDAGGSSRSETACWICGIPLETRKALGPDASGDYMCPKSDWNGCRDRADGVDL